MLSPGDESPLGENRGGTPAGERARKRRAAQAAFLRGASRTPLARGQQTMRLPAFRFLYCRKRVDKRRFVDETASTARSELLRRLVVLVGKLGREKRAARTRLHVAIRLPFPGRSAVRSVSEVPHCRPGIAASSEFAKTPDQRCGISRRTASGERNPGDEGRVLI